MQIKESFRNYFPSSDAYVYESGDSFGSTMNAEGSETPESQKNPFILTLWTLFLDAFYYMPL